MKKTLALLGLAAWVCGADEPKDLRVVGSGKGVVAVIGDSTVCDYPEDSPVRGWGQLLKPYFKDTAKIVNLAKSGRSTKTFLAEGLWEQTLKQKPDFVLIQFGHNDSHKKERPEATDAATDYKDNLRRYIAEARAASAVPVLVTPMHRRTFGKDGKLTQELKSYVDAMKQVAREQQVPLVDLYTMSGELFQKLGDAGSADLSCKAEDRTHFSAKGAKLLAELVMKELAKAEIRIKPLLKE